MKRETAAALALAALCVLSVWNVCYVRGVADELADSVQASRVSVETGDWQ